MKRDEFSLLTISWTLEKENGATCATSSKSSCLFCRARARWRDFPTPVCLLRKASPWFSIQSSTCRHKCETKNRERSTTRGRSQVVVIVMTKKSEKRKDQNHNQRWSESLLWHYSPCTLSFGALTDAKQHPQMTQFSCHANTLRNSHDFLDSVQLYNVITLNHALHAFLRLYFV